MEFKKEIAFLLKSLKNSKQKTKINIHVEYVQSLSLLTGWTKIKIKFIFFFLLEGMEYYSESKIFL